MRRKKSKQGSARRRAAEQIVREQAAPPEAEPVPLPAVHLVRVLDVHGVELRAGGPKTSSELVAWRVLKDMGASRLPRNQTNALAASEILAPLFSEAERADMEEAAGRAVTDPGIRAVEAWQELCARIEARWAATP